MEATIRQSRGSDQAAILRLIIELQEFERAIDDRLIEGGFMAVEYLNALEARCGEQNGTILVAQLGDDVVGFVSVQAAVPSTDLDEPPGSYAWISDLAVSGGYGRLGVGRKLLAAAEAFARQQGAVDVRIGALCGNEMAQSLYASLGYRPYLQIFSKRGHE
jgi:ribosomal protein S18 acetylase RimI-like enzyme